MATSNSGMSLPALDPPTSFAFYPYGLSSQRQTHSSIRGLSLPSTTPDSLTGAGPGPKTEEIVREKLARARAERRALMGRRPPGVALGREAEELSDEEAAMEDEKQNINLFGHRFLLPFGRRLTQMEMEAAPSPSPSEPDQERRQEDRDAGSPVSPSTNQVQQQDGAEDQEEAVDLDASIEDMDASMEVDVINEEGTSGEMEDT